MAYTQSANPFSRRKGKEKREAKKQLKSLYKQGYSDITRTTQADGSVSYSGAGEKGPEQKLDRRSRKNIRQEARGDKMTNDMNIDQKGHRTTEVKELGVNRMSSSPLHQDEYTWDDEVEDPRTGELRDLGYQITPKGEYYDVDEGAYDVNQAQDVEATLSQENQMPDEDWIKLQETDPELVKYRRDLKSNLLNTRGRNEDDPRIIPPPITIPTEGPVEIPTDNPDIITPITSGGPTPTSDQITIGSNRRVKNEKVPVTTSKDVERRRPGMQKVCTNWEWVERGSGQGERRSDAGPRPTVTKTKTKTRMRRI
jgi:hypothetical protein